MNKKYRHIMNLKEVKPTEIEGNPIQLIGNDWLLVTAGNLESYNMMTAAWATLGFLWKKPVCFIFIRPSRYTYEFTEKCDTFSVNFFSTISGVDKKFKNILNTCGSKSGRNFNKMKDVDLTPKEDLGTVYFEEAKQVLLCKKIYFQDIEPSHFLADEIEKNYNGKDYHRMYVGEIKKVLKE